MRGPGAAGLGARPVAAIVVLAAGGSARLRSPKQLVPYRGRSLLRHAVEVALAGEQPATGPVVVVLGAAAERLSPELAGLDVRVVVNDRWEEGLSSSVRAGLDALASAGAPDAALFTTCDQPLVTADLLRRIIAAYEASRSPIVACEYAGTLGVPALFDHSLWGELTELRGDAGARGVIERHLAETVRVPFPDAALDVDSAGDVRRVEAEE